MQLIVEHQGRSFWSHSQNVGEFAPHFGGEYFPCLLWDHAGGIMFEDKEAFATRVINAGCRYAVCAGSECSEWHDAFDWAFVHSVPEEEQEAKLVMTTSHEGETLDDTTFFFVLNTNFHDHDFKQFLVLHLGDSPLRAEVNEWVRRHVLGEVAA